MSDDKEEMINIKKALLSRAEKDRKIKSALPLLRFLLSISGSGNSKPFVNNRWLADEKFETSARTISRWKKMLIDNGYLQEAEYTRVSINLNIVSQKDKSVNESIVYDDDLPEESIIDCDKNGVKEDVSVLNEDKNGAKEDKNVLHKQVNKNNKQKNKIYKHFPFLRHNLVKVTEEQYQELLKELPEEELKGLIKRMDNYCAANGRSYKRWYAALLDWIDRDKQSSAKKSKAGDIAKKGNQRYKLGDEDAI